MSPGPSQWALYPEPARRQPKTNLGLKTVSLSLLHPQGPGQKAHFPAWPPSPVHRVTPAIPLPPQVQNEATMATV